MTKQEILDQIEELRKQVEALDKPQAFMPWKPGMYGTYYSIGSEGDILGRTWDNDSFDVASYSNGNVFKTYEQAEKFAKRRAARNRLELIAEELNGDWVPDFSDDTHKYYIGCWGKLECIGDLDVHSTLWINYGNVYFKSEELAKQALTYLTDEEKIILWGVK